MTFWNIKGQIRNRDDPHVRYQSSDRNVPQKNVRFKAESAKFHKSRTGKALRNVKENRDHSHLRGTGEGFMTIGH